MYSHFRVVLPVLAALAMTTAGCSRTATPASTEAATSGTIPTAKLGGNMSGSQEKDYVPTGDRTLPNALVPPGSGYETAILAGGCFWGMEEILRGIPGVIQTEVGYTGGTAAEATYETVSTETTRHAESVRIVFDPAKLAYSDLLEKWFFRMHDPTTRNRQGNDLGPSYRSAIFVVSPVQRKTAFEVITRVEASGKWKGPIVTEVVDAFPFYRAEDYHQDYLQKHPTGYTCHFLRD